MTQETKDLNTYYYNLPEYLIAQHPLKQREQAKLMVVNRKNGTIAHDKFFNISRYLPSQSSLVFNNSKVVPARLLGYKQRTGGQVEIFLLNRHQNGSMYQVLMRPTRKIKEGDVIRFNGSRLSARILSKENRIAKFNRAVSSHDLAAFGHMPLPPYIRRKDTQEDREYYQTVFAKYAGSVASPTAGLHFTRPMLQSLKRSGHTLEYVTLHINYATFKPVEEDDITQHTMHRERYSISSKTYNRLMKNRDKRKVVCVGTTSCRVLETVAASGTLKGQTDLFIYPGYKFRATDILITNFHQPYSSLLMLIFAFASKELMQRAYQEAVAKKYRFLSYGDAMIIL